MLDYRHCTLCPRACGVDRAAGERGFCQMPDHILAARAALHYWEEPVISGSFGSGAVFFSGCTLGCVFCQNEPISHGGQGEALTSQQLRDIFLRLIDDGVQNMNIVSDTLFVVAGCYYEHDYWQEYDSSDSNQAEPDPAQKLCTMPTHQFKMALRTKSGSTGKRIQECTADELQAVGFWIETFTESPETSARAELRRLAVPVSFIEEKMGMTFFPDVPEEVKTRIPVPEEWGF